MDLFPAIDLRAGRVVRLEQGDYERETRYGDDPVMVAQAFEAAGARWIHVVDLDAARSGVLANTEVIRRINHATSCRVQAGGGVRDITRAEALLDAGVARVVIGTAAIENPTLVEQLALRFAERVVVGLDARGRDVATHGWTTSTGADLIETARRFDRPGVAALVVTEIGRDGTMEGPDVDQLADVLAEVRLPVVASGGVATLDDLRTLAMLDVRGRKLAGVITGRAIYEGRFSVGEAIRACSLSA